MPNIRLMVLDYKRRANVTKIRSVFAPYMPVTIINNNSNIPHPHLPHPVDVINNERNWFCMERWVRCYEYDEPYKLIVDDDLLPHPSLVKKMLEKNLPIVGIYGKSGVKTANAYKDLVDHWNINSKVDFLVGSVILVKQSALNLIKDDIEKIGYPRRGDDIIVSYLLKKYLKLKFLDTIGGRVLNLPELDVGLNKDPEHFNMRWKVIEQFKKISH